MDHLKIAACFLCAAALMVSCMSEKDRQVEGLIRLREAKKGLMTSAITIEAARAAQNATMVYFTFVTDQPDLTKHADSILITESTSGVYREVP